MNKNELYVIVEEMKEMMGTEALLDAFTKAMDSDELQENIEYIDRMHDTGLM